MLYKVYARAEMMLLYSSLSLAMGGCARRVVMHEHARKCVRLIDRMVRGRESLRSIEQLLGAFWVLS